MVWKQCFLKDPLNRYDAFTQFLFLQKEMGRNEDELIVLTLNLYKLNLFMFNIIFITSCRSLHRTPCYHTWHGMWFSFVTIACQCELRCLFLGLLLWTRCEVYDTRCHAERVQSLGCKCILLVPAASVHYTICSIGSDQCSLTGSLPPQCNR